MVNEALSINARDAIYSTRQTMQEADILNISEAEAPMMHSTKEEGKKNESMPMDAHSVPLSSSPRRNGLSPADNKKDRLFAR